MPQAENGAATIKRGGHASPVIASPANAASPPQPLWTKMATIKAIEGRSVSSRVAPCCAMIC